MTARRTLKAVLLVGACLIAATPAGAQQDDRRVQRLEQQVKELRAIVFQGRDTGQPVVVKPAGPDPDVTALSSKVDEQNEQIRHLTGQIETLQHDLDEARRSSEQLKADADARRQAVDDRLGRLEAAQAPPSALAPAGAPDAGAAAVPGSRGAKSAALTAGAYASDGSQFGAPAAPGAAPAADAFQAAYKKLTDADYAGAQTGFEAWLAANASSPRAGEARYYLGQSLYMREAYGDAARAYAQALRGWPKSKWAPEATVKLAQSLVQVDRAGDACTALSEFDRRYGKEASPTSKAHARAARTAAKCGAA